MEVHRCLRCMRAYAPGETVCPVCGNAHGQEKQPDFALRPGTILQDTYLVGKVLGQGGFGITYLGFDLRLESKVAIKEFYPMSTGMVTRDGLHYTSVSWSRGENSESIRQRGTESFLKEARKMARLDSIPGVVGVKSLFIQNETAYIVMSFVDGITLKDQLHRIGRMSFDACVDTLAPVMEAMSRVHKQGIIHRDISPDNIMVRPDGSLWILDLGAAKDVDLRDSSGHTMQSSQLVTKRGFSPAEQYMEHGEIGPWTDVYAMTAMVYFCVTGKLPPAATDRMMEDRLACLPPLTAEQFAVIRAGMTLTPNQRIRTMDDLLARLRSVKTGKKTAAPAYRAPQQIPQSAYQAPQKPGKKSRLPIILGAAAAALAVVVLLILLVAGKGSSPKVEAPANSVQNTVTEDTATEAQISEAEDPNAGIWNVVSAEMYGVDVDLAAMYPEGVYVELKTGGQCAITVGERKANGKWSVAGDQITIDGGVLALTGTISGNEIICENFMNSGMALVFRKEGA